MVLAWTRQASQKKSPAAKWCWCKQKIKQPPADLLLSTPLQHDEYMNNQEGQKLLEVLLLN